MRIALIFGGIAGAVFRAFRALAKERMAGIAAIAVLAITAGSWDGVVFLIAVDVVLFVSIVAEHLRVEKPTPAA